MRTEQSAENSKNNIGGASQRAILVPFKSATKKIWRARAKNPMLFSVFSYFVMQQWNM